MDNNTMLIIILALVLATSIGVSVLLVWYTRGLLKDMAYMSMDLGELKKTLQNYCDHVENVYEMEMFYGDVTLQNLIRHSKAVVEEIKATDYLFSTIEIDGDETNNAEKEDENEEAIFYEGS